VVIEVAPGIALRESELHWEFVRASGPGGQRVNKSATAVQLRFDVLHSPSLPEDTRQRLLLRERKRINEQGEIVIDARRYRSQDRNRQDALKRLIQAVQRAARKPKPRKPSRPTRAARERRLEEKHRRARLKSQRRPPEAED
jgi:ribosome-associated protein